MYSGRKYYKYKSGNSGNEEKKSKKVHCGVPLSGSDFFGRAVEQG
jgi:hypothetical protein